MATELAPVRWSARAEWREPLGELTPEAGRGVTPQPQLWLHLQASAEGAAGLPVLPVALRARRRGRPLVPLRRQRGRRAGEDEDCEEDLLVLEPRFDLSALVEDELLLGCRWCRCTRNVPSRCA